MIYFLVLFTMTGSVEVMEFTTHQHCVNAYEYLSEVKTVEQIVGCLLK
jgi:hypothetical protein